jgi:phosphatidylinositol alpha-1,6-mannosyltransferase
VASSSVLYVTRKYPPSIGGMEAYAATVATALRSHGSTDVVALGRSQRHLAWWLPAVAGRTALGRRRLPPVVVCGDPVVLLALWPVLRRAPVRTAVVVHGLDLTWSPRPYQRLLLTALARVDRVVAISRYSAGLAAARGVAPDRLAVVHPTVDVPPAADRVAARRWLADAAGIDTDVPVLATLGRLVPRKGARWFATEVLPSVPSATYVVAGDGPDARAIRASAQNAGISDRVRLLGAVGDELREAVLGGADLFVMPNLALPGNVEGFGIVAVEAAVRGTPVLGAAVEGIPDALDDGASGWLAPAGDAPAWARRVNELLADREALRGAGVAFAAHAAERASATRFATELGAALGLG